MKAMKKLNAMRFLEQNGVAYEVIEFDDTVHSAQGVADFIGVPSHHVYKTLVVMPDERGTRVRPLLVLTSGDRQLDLKKTARAVGLKKVRMATHQEAEKLTGLKVGGISPLALTGKNWQVYIDQTVLDLEWILLSAGQRGLNLKINAQDLIRVLEIEVIDAS